MDKIAARYDRGSVVVVVDLVITRRESVNVKAVSVKKICQFARTVEIDRLSKSQFLTNLQQPLNYFERCETNIRIFESSHKGKAIYQAAGLACPASD